MQRREFLELTLTTAALAPLGHLAAMPRGDSWEVAFRAALDDAPWLLGYLGCEDRPFDARAELTGTWPAVLEGSLYRNGPGLHSYGGWRYRHLFDGDGLVQRWSFAGGKVRHRARLVATAKLERERAAGRRKLPGFGSSPPGAVGLTSADDLNPANISVLPHGDELLALWEAGSPYALDLHTLATRGRVTFSAETRGLPFSAHPRQEGDGTLWNFGYLAALEKLVLWHFSPDARLARVVVRDVPRVGMPHDFVVTRKHLLLLLPPLYPDAGTEAGTLLDSLRWHEREATRVLVVSKSDLEVVTTLELPAQWVFHFGNAWEDEAGVIRFDAARAPDPGLMTDGFRELMRGSDIDFTTAAARPYRYRIDPGAGTAAEEGFADMLGEFPVVLPADVGRRHDTLVMLGRDPGDDPPHGGLDRVCVFDLAREGRASFRYPDTELPEEHLAVTAADGSRWLLGPSLDWASGQSLLRVFRLDDVAAGPVATARLPYALPLGLHGRFLAG